MRIDNNIPARWSECSDAMYDKLVVMQRNEQQYTAELLNEVLLTLRDRINLYTKHPYGVPGPWRNNNIPRQEIEYEAPGAIADAVIQWYFITRFIAPVTIAYDERTQKDGNVDFSILDMHVQCKSATINKRGKLRVYADWLAGDLVTHLAAYDPELGRLVIFNIEDLRAGYGKGFNDTNAIDILPVNVPAIEDITIPFFILKEFLEIYK